jgi:hypothetical protein
MDEWLRKNRAAILQLQALCRDAGCSGNVPGDVVAFLLSADRTRVAGERVGLPDIADAHVARRLREELPGGLADWVLANLWTRPDRAPTGR